MQLLRVRRELTRPVAGRPAGGEFHRTPNELNATTRTTYSTRNYYPL